MTAPAPDITRQTYTQAELAEVIGLSYSTVKYLVRTKGEVLGVKPIPGTGRRRLFSARAVQRAIHGGEA